MLTVIGILLSLGLPIGLLALTQGDTRNPEEEANVPRHSTGKK